MTSSVLLLKAGVTDKLTRPKYVTSESCLFMNAFLIKLLDLYNFLVKFFFFQYGFKYFLTSGLQDIVKRSVWQVNLPQCNYASTESCFFMIVFHVMLGD